MLRLEVKGICLNKKPQFGIQESHQQLIKFIFSTEYNKLSRMRDHILDKHRRKKEHRPLKRLSGRRLTYKLFFRCI